MRIFRWQFLYGYLGDSLSDDIWVAALVRIFGVAVSARIFKDVRVAVFVRIFEDIWLASLVRICEDIGKAVLVRISRWHPSVRALAGLLLCLELAAPVFMLAPWLWHVLGQGASCLLINPPTLELA